tara:strand:- start:2697 stop:3449 length:753 start_codon:yes stop_codon:yes gene_type:complete
MGKTLNNPKVVLPLAGAAALFLVYRIVPEAFELDRYLPKSDIKQLMDHKATVDLPPLVDPGTRGMKLYAQARWMSGARDKQVLPEEDPFYFYEAPVVTDNALIEPDEPTIEIDPALLDRYIAEHLGLDAQGFFVRFGDVRKRAGDFIRTTGGRDLVLQKIAIAETPRSDAAYAAAVETIIRNLQLLGTMQATAAVGSEIAYIAGGMRDDAIYRTGDFVAKNPVVSLYSILPNSVELIDRKGTRYKLLLPD